MSWARQLLCDRHAVRSQSHRSDYYDNAQAESLWSRLKTEVLELRERPIFADLADAQRSVAVLQSRTPALQYRLPDILSHSPTASST